MASLLLCAQCAAGRPVQDPCPETCLVPAHAPSHRPALRLWGPHGPGGHRFTGPDREGISLTWTHEFLVATGSQLGGRETGLPLVLAVWAPDIP